MVYLHLNRGLDGSSYIHNISAGTSTGLGIMSWTNCSARCSWPWALLAQTERLHLPCIGIWDVAAALPSLQVCLARAGAGTCATALLDPWAQASSGLVANPQHPAVAAKSQNRPIRMSISQSEPPHLGVAGHCTDTVHFGALAGYLQVNGPTSNTQDQHG
ncbi:PSMC3 [Symbiodinium natans]|uniref:PSMC3 protein n=1 Tax=Symbiodinium natans TaxID=878477 RepID=A0A812SZE0_9DINO|nr:PSMC3 [Symbiodinium natans]